MKYILPLLLFCVPAQAEVVREMGGLITTDNVNSAVTIAAATTLTGPLTLSGSSLTVTEASSFGGNLALWGTFSTDLSGLSIKRSVSGNVGIDIDNGFASGNSFVVIRASTSGTAFPGVLLYDGAAVKSGLSLERAGSPIIGATRNDTILRSVGAHDIWLAPNSTKALRVASGGAVSVTGSAFSVGTATFVVTGGNVGIGTTTPASTLQIGASLNGTTNYLQIDTLAADTAGPPAATDCDAATEVGRMVLSSRYTATADNSLWVCLQTAASTYAWWRTALNAP